MRSESFCGQIRSHPIAARQPRSTQKNLSRFTFTHWSQVVVKDVGLHVLDGRTCAGLLVIWLALANGCVNCCFSRCISIEDGPSLAPFPDETPAGALAAKDDGFE